MCLASASDFPWGDATGQGAMVSSRVLSIRTARGGIETVSMCRHGGAGTKVGRRTRSARATVAGLSGGDKGHKWLSSKGGDAGSGR
jgi:hypothetical protein